MTTLVVTELKKVGGSSQAKFLLGKLPPWCHLLWGRPSVVPTAPTGFARGTPQQASPYASGRRRCYNIWSPRGDELDRHYSPTYSLNLRPLAWGNVNVVFDDHRPPNDLVVDSFPEFHLCASFSSANRLVIGSFCFCLLSWKNLGSLDLTGILR